MYKKKDTKNNSFNSQMCKKKYTKNNTFKSLKIQHRKIQELKKYGLLAVLYQPDAKIKIIYT